MAGSLWPPSNVTKEQRRQATFVWVGLLAGYFAYVIYTVYDAVQARNNPVASVRIVREAFPFPDVGICLHEGEGCAGAFTSCAENLQASVTISDHFSPDNGPVVARHGWNNGTDDLYLNCAFLNLSGLAFDPESEESSVSAQIYLFWPRYSVEPEEAIETDRNEFRLNFVDLQAEEVPTSITVETFLPFREFVFDAELPGYELIQSNVIMGYTEYESLEASGDHGKSQAVHQTSVTSSPWIVTTNDTSYEDNFYHFVQTSVFLAQTEFLYQVVQEVDPVAVWTILGSIGGFWELLVIAFGIFFFARTTEANHLKARNWRKTVNKPIYVISTARSHMTGSRESVVDASDEDLPADWVKVERSNGTCFYRNTVTRATQDSHPLGQVIQAAHRGIASTVSASGRIPVPVEGPRRSSQRDPSVPSQQEPVIAPVATVGARLPVSAEAMAQESPGSSISIPRARIASNASQQSAASVPAPAGTGVPLPRPALPPLPAQFSMKFTKAGRPYYVNHETKTTQWQRPT